MIPCSSACAAQHAHDYSLSASGCCAWRGGMGPCLRACADLHTCDNSNTALGCCAGRVRTRRLSGAPLLL